MNVFYSDPNPALSAQALDNRRLFKMGLESGQLLATAMHLSAKFPHLTERLYRSSHSAHPLQAWAQQPLHFDWLYDHFIALCQEWEYRTGNTHPSAHQAEYYFEALTTHFAPAPIGHFEIAVPQSARIVPDQINFNPHPEAYRHFLLYKWAVLDPNKIGKDGTPRPMVPVWGKRGIPSWLPAVAEEFPKVFADLHPHLDVNSILASVKLPAELRSDHAH